MDLLKHLVIAVLIAALINVCGIVWINYDLPGAWPPWLGPDERAVAAGLGVQ